MNSLGNIDGIYPYSKVRILYSWLVKRIKVRVRVRIRDIGFRIKILGLRF